MIQVKAKKNYMLKERANDPMYTQMFKVSHRCFLSFKRHHDFSNGQSYCLMVNASPVLYKKKKELGVRTIFIQIDLFFAK